MGSGEFEPWAEEVDRWLLERTTNGDGTVLILPTASAPEGDSVFDMWADMGLTHYGRLGIPAEVVPIKTKNDADRPEHARRLERASMAFFSGGNPAYLASVLSGSAFWLALLDAMERGLAYGGCSGGVACLGEVAPDSSVTDFAAQNFWRPGLGLFPELWVAPHWDALDTFVPGIRDFIVQSVPADGRLLALDEWTAIVGDGRDWTVLGSGGAHLMQTGDWRRAGSGESFTAALIP
jgi:cyanophycinase-like exopeptidase